ncbi:membrane bound O-acyl transferase family-domain-containing protein [Xylariaceae sp. FL1019]|nr:membrane bound O-acyl transferase family-domain-containing protein [Xylariaceae sp. FL1019]
MKLIENYLEPVAFAMLPVVLLIISFTFFHFSLQSTHSRFKYLCLLFGLLSFKRSTDLPSEIQPMWANASVVSLLHVATFFCFERNVEPQHNGSEERTQASLHSSWQLWTNYRDLPTDSRVLDPRKRASKSVFLLLQLSKLPLYYQLRCVIEPKAFALIIGSLRSEDVASFNFLSQIPDLSSHRVRVQFYFAISWIFINFITLDGLHAILAIIHVSSGYDAPEQWPPIFGTIENACGLRNFWSRFWHNLAESPFKSVAHETIRRLPCCFRESKAAFAFMVFLVSGCAHALASNVLGGNGWLDIKWYLLNFVACCAETTFMRVVHYLARRAHWDRELKQIETSWLGRFVGLSWVFGFFFLSVPLWQFPRMHVSLKAMENDAAWERWESLLFQHTKLSSK